MSTQNMNLTEGNLPEWLDPFPEPQTIPGGWNVENIAPGAGQRAVEPAGASAEHQPVDPGSTLTLHA